MTRIGATISGIERQLLNQLATSHSRATVHSLRLATGRKVNRPSDDPAAFLQISSLESRLQVVNSAYKQVQGASSVAAQTQLVLDQVRSHLNMVRSTLLEDENLSLNTTARNLKQAEIDEALQQINRLASTEINGRRLLDGSANFRFSGLDTSQIRDVQVFSLGPSSVSGEVVQAAEQGTLRYTGPGQKVQSNATFTLIGSRGSMTLTVRQNDALSDVAEQINRSSHQTGITAATNGNQLNFTTVDYGSRARVAVEVLSGSFAVNGGNGDGTAQGSDMVAQINGRRLEGSAVADGNRVTLHQNGLHLQLEFAAGFTGSFSPFTIAADRVPTFSLSPDPHHVAQLGLPSVQTALFRGISGSLDQLASGGALAGLGNNTSQALRVVDEALDRLGRIEGRVNRFADISIKSSSDLLRGMQAVLEDSLEQANSINPVEESLLLSRHRDQASHILASLSLLQDQRSQMISFLHNLR